MEDVLTELQDSQTPEAQPETEAKSEETVSKAEFDKVFARAKQAEEKVKSFRDKQPEAVNESYIEEIVNLRADGHSKDEVEYIKAFAKGRGKSLAEAAKDPFIQAGIQGLRSQTKTQAASPSPSSRPIPVNSSGKSFAQMTPEERQANFSAVTQKYQKGGRSHE